MRRVFSVAIKIEENIDSVGGDLCGCLVVVKAIVDPMVGGLHDPLLRGVSSIDPAIVSEDFKVFTIMLFKVSVIRQTNRVFTHIG